MLCVMGCISITAQTKNLYDWFDSQLGIENLDLYNGVEFFNSYRLEDNAHRFFELDAFRLGSVTYNNQVFNNIPLIYDLYEDQLIIKVEKQNGVANQFVLLKEKIEAFSIGNSKFVKITEVNSVDNQGSMFLQLLTSNNAVNLCKKNLKKMSKVLKNSSLSYKFLEQKPEYYIMMDMVVYPLKKKKDLITLFPEFKKELSKYKWTSKNINSNDAQLMAAINQLEQLLSL